MLSLWSEQIGSKWTSGPVTRSPDCAAILGLGPRELMVGIIWFGFPAGQVPAGRRTKRLADIVTLLP